MKRVPLSIHAKKMQTTTLIRALSQSKGKSISFSNERKEDEMRVSHSDDGQTQSSNANDVKEKKKRGPTRMGLMAGLNPHLKIEFNERGQVVGDNSDNYASYLGVIVREHVPIVIKDWHRVTSAKKDELWILVKQRYDVEDHRRSNALKRMGSYWTQYKASITKKIIQVGNKKKVKALEKIRPRNILNDYEWKKFTDERLSNSFSEKRRWFQKIRTKHQLAHTTSRKGYARLEFEMKKKNPELGESISRADVWTQGHLYKDGNPKNMKTAEALDKIKNWQNMNSVAPSNYKDDALANVLGEEKPGHVRGLGAGVTPSNMDGLLKSKGREKELQQQILCQQMVIDTQNKNIEKMMSGQNELRGEVAMLKDMLSKQIEVQRKSVDDMMSETNHSSKSQQGSGGSYKKKKASGGSYKKKQASGGSYKEKQDSGGMDRSKVVEKGRKCQLLNWHDDSDKDVLAEGSIADTDPNAMVHHVRLGNDAWRVWVERVYRVDFDVYRSSDIFEGLGDAKGSSIAWPTNAIRLI